MIERLIKIILPISLILLASCHSKKEERQQYTLGAPEAKEGVEKTAEKAEKIVEEAPKVAEAIGENLSAVV